VSSFAPGVRPIGEFLAFLDPLGVCLRCGRFDGFTRFGPWDVTFAEGFFHIGKHVETNGHIQERPCLLVVETQTLTRIVHRGSMAVLEIELPIVDFLKIKTKNRLETPVGTGEGSETPIDLVS
jgi:hypothetical protein